MFLPKSMTTAFHYVDQYDMMYGEYFYDLTWNDGVDHNIHGNHKEIYPEAVNGLLKESNNNAE